MPFWSSCKFSHAGAGALPARPGPQKQHHEEQDQNSKDSSEYVVSFSDQLVQDISATALFAGNGVRGGGSWAVDSGCTCHMCCDKDAFTNLRRCRPVQINVADGPACAATWHGTVKFNVGGKEFILNDVLYVPDFSMSLLSVRALDGSGMQCTFGHGRCVVYANGKPVLEAPISAGLYRFVPDGRRGGTTETHGGTEGALASRALWHRRLGHRSGRTIREMHRDGRVNGLDLDGPPDRHMCVTGKVCRVCGVTKGRRRGYPLERQGRGSKPGEFWAADVLGPFLEGVYGEKYIVHFICMTTSYEVTQVARTKGGLFRRWQSVLAWSERQTGNKVKGFDADGAFATHEFKRWATRAGVDLRITMTDSPGQNGLAERHGGTHVQMTRSLMVQSKAPAVFWPFASNTAGYIKNRVTCRSVTGERRTPYEAFLKRKPDISDMRVWGCRMYAKAVPEHAKATAVTRENGVAGIFVGYADKVRGELQYDQQKRKGYLMYDEETRRVYSTRNARFVEDEFPTVTRLPIRNKTVRHNVGGGTSGGQGWGWRGDDQEEPAGADADPDNGGGKEEEEERKGGGEASEAQRGQGGEQQDPVSAEVERKEGGMEGETERGGQHGQEGARGDGDEEQSRTEEEQGVTQGRAEEEKHRREEEEKQRRAEEEEHRREEGEKQRRAEEKK